MDLNRASPDDVDMSVLFDEARLEALRRSELLDTPSESAFDRVTSIASRLAGTPVALISIVDDHRQYFKSAVGLPDQWESNRETPLSFSFCKYVVATDSPLVVEDALKHPLVGSSPAAGGGGVVAYCGVPLHDDEGNVLGSVCVVDGAARKWTDEDVSNLRDLAEIVRAELRLRRELAQESTRAVALASANSALNRFATTVAHDLRGPLTAISGFTQILTQLPVSDEERDEMLGQVDASTTEMIDLVSMLLLDAAQSGADVPPMDGESFEHWLRGLTSPQLAAVDGVMAIDVPTGELPVDSMVLRRVAANLVGNALKYGLSDEQLQIDVRIGQGNEGDFWALMVDDNGPGIPAEQRLWVMERGTRLHQDDRGHGLGLADVNELVQEIGGRIAITDSPSGGARFTVTMPIGS